MRRLVDRLSDTPVAVFDAAWTHLDHNDLWTALTGSDWPVRGEGRADGYGGDAANLVRRTFFGDTAPVRHPSPERHRAALVADLRDTAARYPADRELAAMVDELRRSSTEFARLWTEGRVARHETAVKTFDHARVGPLEVDCDVLSASGSDVRVVVYTAAPGSEAAGKLRLLSVLGAACAADGAGDRSGAV
ncbi:hypothetical protein [Streptomyces sp. Z26]|uniref:MmyB family transcriptional regulator n=1 Tax=Streptomyces sp. Z26 TaxID=2500177 RepID=UPI0026857A30